MSEEKTSDMKAVIIDYRADKEIINSLKSLGFDIIPTVENKEVSPPLWGHADMQICKCSDNVFISTPLCYEYYKNKLADFNVKIICGKTTLGSNYPKDIAYNVAWIGKSAIHNFDYTDANIKEYFLQTGIDMINVLQGYSKCTICVVSEGAVITSDIGISKTLLKHGTDVLTISNGNININGWEYGFIGGASGKISDNTLAFCGDISAHPDYNKIKEFCSNYNVECISLSRKRLMDLGSVILVEDTIV